MELSIVTTMFNSAVTLPRFYEQIVEAAKSITDDYELIFVNDGSPDESLKIATTFIETDSKVKVVDLSRNFGHHRAIMTGLSFATGKNIFLIDCDLEEDPALLSLFSETMELKKCDVVFGVQSTRKGGAKDRFSGKLFYKLFNLLSATPIPANPATVRLMTQHFVTALLEHNEREVFLAGIFEITGFSQVPVIIEKQSRKESSYQLSKKLSLLVNAITSFSNRPLYFIFLVGTLLSFASGCMIAILILQKLAGGVVSGWTSIVVSIWFLGGLTILFLGVIGIYLSKIFVEVKQRPYSIVRAVYGGHNSDKTEPLSKD